MGSAGVLPSAEEIRRLVPGRDEGEKKTIRSVNAEGDEFDLRLQSCAVRWNGTDAKAVYCVPVASQSKQSDAVENPDGTPRLKRCYVKM